MLFSYSNVLIFCPEVPSGGPEALHQLAYMIRQHGGSAQMVYTGPKSNAYIDGDTLHCTLSPETTIQRHFSAYMPIVAENAKLDDKTLLIYPEVMTRQAKEWPVAQFGTHRAVWWLSVDSAFHCNESFCEEEYRSEYFKNSSLIHLYQSAHAREFLKANGAQNYYPLFDFTDRDFVFQSQIKSGFSEIEARRKTICFFPRKGGPLAELFVKSFDWEAIGVEFLPIQDMTKIQVRDALFRSKIYIDFGFHPGKDRVPREAAIAGSLILLMAVGAAKQFEDHPLDRYYLFNEQEVASGDLQKKVLDMIENCKKHYEKQRIYRQSVLWEHEQFSMQVRSLFFSGAR